MTNACVAGVEIGGTKIQVVLGTPRGKILERRRYSVVKKHGAAGIQKQILEGLHALKRMRPFDAIGVGFGGPIDWRTGRVFKSHHIEGWNGFPLGAWLRSKFRVHVVADNDANVAALAEATLGAGRGRNPVFYMTIGSGIGGGMVHDGEIYHGAHPGEVEVGHTRIPFPHREPKDWPILEELCSGWSLDRQVRAVARAHRRSPLAIMIGARGGKEARWIPRAIARGDADAKRIWEAWCRHLALGLSHVTHLFHPQVLIVGGGVSQWGEPMLRELRCHLKIIVMSAYQGTFTVELASLGEDAVPVGALLLAGRSR